ncbi:hypothetical protein KBC70_03595 [Candidatus Woesebacteria bacterium]|nr:hypothetical protein [Candidatus Woesebacteria bacterium]
MKIRNLLVLAAVLFGFFNTSIVHATDEVNSCTENHNRPQDIWEGQGGDLAENDYLLALMHHPVFTSQSMTLLRGPKHYKLENGGAIVNYLNCDSETELRAWVFQSMAGNSIDFTFPYAFLLDGKKESWDGVCVEPMVNQTPQLDSDWTLPSGHSALVFNQSTGEYSILDALVGNMRVHNNSPLVVQILPTTCSKDLIMDDFVVGLRAQGTFVRPERLVTINSRVYVVLPVLNIH